VTLDKLISRKNDVMVRIELPFYLDLPDQRGRHVLNFDWSMIIAEF